MHGDLIENETSGVGLGLGLKNWGGGGKRWTLRAVEDDPRDFLPTSNM
jgi:hypothetical protein